MASWSIASAFSGIGAWEKALDRVTKRHGDDSNLKYFFEIDKYASNAFCAIHGVDESLNLWDITKDVDVPEVDIFFYSPPCQSFSIAGKKEGRTVAKGNLFDSALEKLIKSNPKFAIMENVSNLANQFEDDYIGMLNDLEKAGYVNYAKVLNTKDYGVPQNRERVFIVSIRKDLYDDGKRFEFPKPMKLEKRLKDVLEPVVSDKYLLSEKMIKCLLREGTDFNGRLNPKTGDEIANALTTRFDVRSTDNFIYVKSNTIDGYEIAYPGDSINIDFPGSNTRRGRVGKGLSQTITTSMGIAYYNGFSIRGLTIKEGFRLQGFNDEDYEKAIESYDKTFTKGKSSTQMKIRVGNSITVNVIEEILENLLYDRKQEGQQLSFI